MIQKTDYSEFIMGDKFMQKKLILTTFLFFNLFSTKLPHFEYQESEETSPFTGFFVGPTLANSLGIELIAGKCLGQSKKLYLGFAANQYFFKFGGLFEPGVQIGYTLGEDHDHMIYASVYFPSLIKSKTNCQNLGRYLGLGYAYAFNQNVQLRVQFRTFYSGDRYDMSLVPISNISLCFRLF